MYFAFRKRVGWMCVGMLIVSDLVAELILGFQITFNTEAGLELKAALYEMS
jgi:hypothetical protein